MSRGARRAGLALLLLIGAPVVLTGAIAALVVFWAAIGFEFARRQVAELGWGMWW